MGCGVIRPVFKKKQTNKEEQTPLLPEQKATETTGGGLLEGVHLELVGVVVGFLRSYV